MALVPDPTNPWVLRARRAQGAAAAEGGAAAPLHVPPPLSPPPRLMLLCFPPAGSGGGLFQGWQEALQQAGVEVLAVELPGRGSRMREPAIDCMDSLMGALLAALLPELSARPCAFSFFGHSMGAWVAYQLTRELRRCGGPLPLKLYVSANRSPLLAGVQHDVDSTLMHCLPPDQFWRAMQRRYGANPNLEHPAVRRMLLPMMQADFRLIETWQPAGVGAAAQHGAAAGNIAAEEGDEQSLDWQQQRRRPELEHEQGHACPVLPCPVTALGAESDTRYTRGQLAAWAECVPPGGYQELWFEGGHTYIASPDSPGRQQLLAWLAEDLALLQQLSFCAEDAAAVREQNDTHGAENPPHDSCRSTTAVAGGTTEAPAHFPQQQAPDTAAAPSAAAEAAAEALMQPPSDVMATRQQGHEEGQGQQSQVQPLSAAPAPAFKVCWCW